MLWAILNKSWRQHPTRQQLYGHLPPITKTIQVRRTRHAGQCWRSRDELISDVFLWTPTYGGAKVGRPARTYSSSVRIRDVALKTCQKRWTIGRSGERGSGISVVAARHNDDDDIANISITHSHSLTHTHTHTHIYIYIYILQVKAILLEHDFLFVRRPTERASMAQGLFKVGPDAGPQPIRVRHCQKCLRRRQHSPSEGRLRCQAINLLPPRKGVKAWRDGLPECGGKTPVLRHTWLDPCQDQTRPTEVRPKQLETDS